MNTSPTSQHQVTPPRLPAPRPTTQMRLGCFVIPAIVAILGLGVFLFVRFKASDQLMIPEGEVVLVHAEPDPSAPLLARFGQGQMLNITGRTGDWRWLEVELWNNRRGWTLRPLDILVWQLDAQPATPAPPTTLPAIPTPVPEEMVTIPATTFTMGGPPGLGSDDERPAHSVSLSAFEIDRTEVTTGQYWQCVQAGACAPPTHNASSTEPHYLNDPAFDNYPVINIPWTEANNYCIWRGKRLPTEAEWELAAGWEVEKKAKFQWPWGNNPVQGEGNVGDAAVGDVAVVGTFPGDKSPVGVMDMAGNVSEWVFDWYKVDYYSVADDTDPVGPTYRRGEGSGRGVRGGTFADSLDEARTTNRRHQAEGYGYPMVGFRCARDR